MEEEGGHLEEKKELEQLVEHQQNAQVSLEMLCSLFSFQLGWE